MIILTDSLRDCPDFEERVGVKLKLLSKYDGDAEVEAIVCSRATAKKVLEIDFPKLRYIQLFSAGYDGIDLKLVKEKGITLCNAANVYNIGMAEFVVYAMLMRAKRYHRSLKNHKLRPLRNYHYLTELFGKTAGIIGCGNIGCQIAKRLSAFEMNVIGYDVKSEDKPYFDHIFGPNDRKGFVAQCDYIVNCIPLMPATERMLDNSWFSMMKDDVTFVNVARKNTLNDDDFIPYLRSHKDVTAILDMLEMIPNPITNPYRRLSNVLVLPGVTAASIESGYRLSSLILDNVKRFKSGEELLNVIVKP